MRQIPVRQLREEVDIALWDLDMGDEPGSVVRSLLYRLRTLEHKRTGGLWFRLKMFFRLDRGGIAW